MLQPGPLTDLRTWERNDGSVSDENAAETWIFPAYRGHEDIDGQLETDRPDETIIRELQFPDHLRD
jgi:hypothetical protein